MINFRRLLKSFMYAGKGLFKTFKEEQNLRVQTSISLLVVVLAWLLKVTYLEWALLILAISLVILMEVVNSAVERITDVLKPRINGYVKEIKDIMAAAVMLASLTAVMIGIIVLGPYVIKLIWR